MWATIPEAEHVILLVMETSHACTHTNTPHRNQQPHCAVPATLCLLPTAHSCVTSTGAATGAPASTWISAGSFLLVCNTRKKEFS